MRVLLLIMRHNVLASDWLFGLCKRYSDWLKFSDIKIKITLICRLPTREDQALILITTILNLKSVCMKILGSALP